MLRSLVGSEMCIRDRFIILRPSVLSLLVVTQMRGHIAGSFPPLPTAVRALHFYREKISALSSLVDSRRTVLTHARRSQQLALLFFFFAKKFKISPRRDSNSRTNGPTPVLIVFKGYHYVLIRGIKTDHQDDRLPSYAVTPSPRSLHFDCKLRTERIHLSGAYVC